MNEKLEKDCSKYHELLLSLISIKEKELDIFHQILQSIGIDIISFQESAKKKEETTKKILIEIIQTEMPYHFTARNLTKAFKEKYNDIYTKMKTPNNYIHSTLCSICKKGKIIKNIGKKDGNSYCSYQKIIAAQEEEQNGSGI